MYSASVLEIAALFCLFDDQLIIRSPRNCTLPDISSLVKQSIPSASSKQRASLSVASVITTFFLSTRACNLVTSFTFFTATEVDEGADEVNVKDVSTAGVAAEGVVSAADDVVPTAVEALSITSPTPPTSPPQPLQDQPSTSQDAGISMDLLQNLMDTCTTLTRRVEHLEHDKRLKNVGTTQRIETFDDTLMDDLSKQGRIIADMDADKDVIQKDVAATTKDVQDAKIDESVDVQGRQAESRAQIYQINLEHADKVLSMQDDEGKTAELQEVVEVVTTAKLITEVVIAASATITAATPQLTTAATPTLTTALSTARRRKGVVIRDPQETTTPSTIIHSKAKSKDKGWMRDGDGLWGGDGIGRGEDGVVWQLVW
nr:hypothetical protein [Tanacetum cinerariifolium]